MIKSLYTAASGVYAQQLNVDIIANNLANINTNGYKQVNATFADLLYQFSPYAPSSNEPIIVGSGSRLASTQRDFAQGTLVDTGRYLDIAIEGRGYLQVQNTDGTISYTRDGSLTIADDGRLMTSNGYILYPQITVPQGTQRLDIQRNGVVRAELANGNSQIIGRINLANFNNINGLESLGNNLFAATTVSGAAQVGNPETGGRGSLQQGYVERSNVDIAQQMTNLIIGQRAYELSSRAIKTADEMMAIANDIRR